MIPVETQIRSILLYEFKLGSKAAETARKICSVFGEDVLSERKAQFWFSKFRGGDETLEDEVRSGRPTVVDKEDVRRVVELDPRQSCSEIASQLNISATTAWNYLKELGKVKKLDKWIPHKLSDANMLVRLTTASSLTSRLKVEPFLNRFITCDEKWVLYNNFRRSYQWLSADEKPKQFPKPDLHPKKVLLIVFWTAKGIVHFEILNQGQTITAEVYCNILDHCQSKLKTFDPCLVNRRRPLLLQDNARPHTAKLTREKLTEIGWEVLPHPPYSPDLSPTDYHLFRDLDNNLRQKCFQDRDNLIHELTTYFCSYHFVVSTVKVRLHFCKTMKSPIVLICGGRFGLTGCRLA
ncbi:histone-lysine N-methyltransferase SETMAR-like [Halyomorpha halys]|uniref:histone-lysine N-methyltransferase SETMAR-like n=1 Tax=Halyomorpha halys TaxID=286706 RepID=UPI0034D3765D